MIIMAVGMKEDVETESLDVKVCRNNMCPLCINLKMKLQVRG
jgi:hypothetical protein